MLPRLDGETDDAIKAKILGFCALKIWLCHHSGIRIPLVHIHSWAGLACLHPELRMMQVHGQELQISDTASSTFCTLLKNNESQARRGMSEQLWIWRSMEGCCY